MEILYQTQNRASGFIRVASVLLLGARAPCSSGLCLPALQDCCPLPSYQPNSGYPCCPSPSYCVQNVVVGSQGQESDKDKTSNCDPQTNDPCCSYIPQDVSTYCCRDPRTCCEDDPSIIWRRILASLQLQQSRNNQCGRRTTIDPCCSNNGIRSFSDPSIAFSSSGMRSGGFGSFSDPSLGYGSLGSGSLGSASALRSLLDPSLTYSSSGLMSVSDPSSLLSSRSSYLLDPYILSQISDPQNNCCDPSSYSYDPCCNTCNPCNPCCNPCNPCCRIARQPCCKKTQRRVILIDNVSPDCFV